MTERILLTLAQAAESVGMSVDTIRRATKATDPARFPHPLPSKLAGNVRRIKATDLAAWVDAMPDG